MMQAKRVASFPRRASCYTAREKRTERRGVASQLLPPRLVARNAFGNDAFPRRTGFQAESIRAASAAARFIPARGLASDAFRFPGSSRRVRPQTIWSNLRLSGLSGCWRNWWYRSRISRCVAIRMPSLLIRFCFSCWSDVPIAQRRRQGRHQRQLLSPRFLVIAILTIDWRPRWFCFK